MVSEKQGVAGVRMEVKQGNCHKVTVETEGNGGFEFALPGSVDGSPVPVTAVVGKQGFEEVMWTFSTGGVPKWRGGIDLELVPSGVSSLKVTLNSAFRNKQIENCTLTLRTGYGNFTGPSFLSHFLNNTKAVYFPSLPAGIYSLSAEGNNHARADTEIALYPGKTLSTALLLSPMDLTAEQIRVTLTWSGDNVDLDMRLGFRLNENVTCLVGYERRLCAGAKLTSESISGTGGESITLQQVGPYQYFLYIQGNQSISSAEVSVYTSARPYPILRLKSPRSAKSIWNVFCLNGLEGVGTLFPISQTSDFPVDIRVCEQVYGAGYTYRPEDKGLVMERNNTEVPLPGAFKHWPSS